MLLCVGHVGNGEMLRSEMLEYNAGVGQQGRDFRRGVCKEFSVAAGVFGSYGRVDMERFTQVGSSELQQLPCSLFGIGLEMWHGNFGNCCRCMAHSFGTGKEYLHGGT